MATQSFSSADRIRELTSINSDVASMLSAAGQAINALTNRPLNAPEDSDNDNDTNMDTDSTQSLATLEARKAAFQRTSTAFYTNLQSVVAQLRRQAYALEEAGIITSEATSLSTISVQAPPKQPQNQPGRPPQQPEQQVERITNGGLGNQDIGHLNSQGNRVGADKEKELVEDARKLVGDVLEGGHEG